MNRTLEQIISIPLWIPLGISTTTHWEMTKSDYKVKKLKRATYAEIKHKMLTTAWAFDPNYQYSLFARLDNSYFHASIFRFDDIGYLLTPYGYLMANILQRKIRKTLPDYTLHAKPYVK